MSSNLLQALREGTANAHRALESEMDFLNSTLTLPAYVAALQIFHAFVSSWEAEGAAHCPEHLADFFNRRRRTRLLEADLDFFKAPPLDARPALPKIETPSSFFGALYVMEGSTLGGQVIARQLESALHLSEGKGYSYFRGHGSETGRMWKQFVELLTCQEPFLQQAKVVVSASAMFAAFQSFHAQQARLR